MALDLQALLALQEKLGFYGAGGGKRDWGERVGGALSSVGKGLGDVGTGLGEGADAAKKMFEAQKLKNEITNLGSRLGLPDAKTEALKNQIFQNQSASQVAPNIYPQPSESQESPASIGPNIPQVQASNPLQAPPTPRANFQQAHPELNLDATLDENLKLGQLNALAGGIAIWTNPTDPSKPPIIQPKTMAAPSGYILQGVVPTKTGAPLAVTNANANAPQDVYDAASQIGKKVKKGDRLVTSQQQGVNPYAAEKTSANILAELPSNQAATTAGGAAAGIQVAARQGKAIIAKAGTPQDLQLASSDLARAVQRSAPLAEILNGASYANTWQTEMNQLIQKITSNPNAKDVPLLRQKLFQKFDELQESSTPFIQRQMDQIKTVRQAAGTLPKDWDAMLKRELGTDLPPIKLQDIPSTEQKVRVMAPDGTVGEIPVSQLDKAVKKGYRPK